MISRFFIDRPIFATVLSVAITLAGGLSLLALPITQYPAITPPTIEVSTIYPGANARLVRDTVAEPIEQQISGVENALYMSSQCTNDGRYRLLITFAPGTDLDVAQVVTQVRVSLALPVLPNLVQREGVSVLKKSPAQLMLVNLTSPDRRYDDIYLSNYATIQIRDELLRLDGVGDVTFLGQRNYSMRAWLDPQKLATVNLTVGDVIESLEQQNVQVAAGSIGQQPVPAGQNFQFTLNALGRLWEPEQFGAIILASRQPPREGQDATLVRLSDVARIELGAQQYEQVCTLNGQPSVALSIYQLPGSNAIHTARLVRAKMTELAQRFPAGLKYDIVYDTTPFIRESIIEVLRTLRDAIILVAIVVLVFLQNWRASLIPLAAVPVAIIGTFAAMAALGFSLNNLTLFGLVLAIGIVVDDAIVVVENVERWIEHGLSPNDATVRAMAEVTGPVIGVALVLSAVFIPCAFLAGIVGQFFRQFALTIAVSTVISAFISLTLSPALAALLLRPRTRKPDPLTRLLDGCLGWFFRLFNRAFDRSTGVYVRLVGLLLRGSLISLLLYGGLLFLTYWTMERAPTGFIPEQDKGYLIVNVQLPDGASVQRTQAVMEQIDELARQTEGVASTVAISGQSLLLDANAPNWGSMYVMLAPFRDRKRRALQGPAIAAVLRERCLREVQEAEVTVFGPPPVSGLGTVAGFKFVLEDRGNFGQDKLQAVADALVAEGNRTPGLEGLFTNVRSNAPWLDLDIDREKARSLNVEIQAIFHALQVNLGSYYVNNFNRFGRSWQVNLQAAPQYRTHIRKALEQIQVRNADGEMVPLATLIRVRQASGPVLIMRYNLYAAAAVNGNVAPGTSSGVGLELMDRLYQQGLAADEIPRQMTFAWTEMAYLQVRSGSTAMYLFALGVLLVFLVLAGLYESWLLPLAVILVVPLCLLCSLVGVFLARLDVNIFTQIGFVVLVGLASKNAILIVAFANQQRLAGVPRREATLEACRLRLRPILMTSFAFIFGVVPLVLASGAGWEMRHALGTAVFSGMIGVTFFGIFLTPVLYEAVLWLKPERAAAGARKGAGTVEEPGPGGELAKGPARAH